MNKARLLVVLCAVSLLSGCGYTVESARETAAQKVCDYAVRCNQVGAGAAYTTRDNCLTQWRSWFLTNWPDSVCTNATLNASNLDTCFKGIDATACGALGGIDIFSNAVKCSALTVCNVRPDGG